MMKPNALLALLWMACLGLVAFTAVADDPSEDAAAKEPKAQAADQQTEKPGQGLADSLDWTSWRGPEQNGISRQTGLPDSWDPEGENLLWKSEKLGGRSTPIVMQGKLYTIVAQEPGTPREREKVVCADAATGEILWENDFNVYLSDVPVERVGWSSCVGDPATGRIYAMGVAGLFQCLDAETGKTIWSRSLSEEFGLLSTYGGRTNTPVLHEDLVIISAVFINWGATDPKITYQAFDKSTGGWGDMAKPAHRFLAMNKETGEVVWFNGTKLLPDDTTYSTPTITTLNGQLAMIFGSGDGAVYAMQPRTGNLLWKFQLSQRGLNVSPVVDGTTVYTMQSEENPEDTTMGSVVAINAIGEGDITESGQIWRIKGLMAGKSSPLLIDGRLYFVDDGGGLWVLDAKTGEQIGAKTTGRTRRANQKLGSMMRASLLWADGKIYACEANGRCFVLEPTEDGVKVVHRLRLPEGEEVHASPIVAHGRVYIPSTGSIYCIAKEGAETALTEAPEPPAEAAVGEDDKPAHLQIVPAEVLLKPGQEQKFQARLFNANGRFLRETDAEYAVAGPGEIDSEGNYKAVGGEHQAATISAKVGQVEGLARIRIVPPLPWTFDFADQQIPITWIGARYRHQVRDLEGNPAMVKVTTIPKGTRSQAWMGPSDLHDYTIQADVRGAIANGKMPDIGLIGQRYTLDLMGASQQLQIRSWPPQIAHRATTTVPFEWQPDVWYTMKFRSAVEDGKAVLRGKVWKRDDSEPEEWTAVLSDDAPNLVGSPGLFGKANDAEIFIDNIVVTSNEDQPTAQAKVEAPKAEASKTKAGKTKPVKQKAKS